MTLLQLPGATPDRTTTSDRAATGTPVERVRYELDPGRSHAEFQVPFLWMRSRGRMPVLGGHILLAVSDPTDVLVSAEVGTDGVRTGIALRDRHLRSPSYLDARAHPTAHYAGTRLDRHVGDRLRLRGTLTLRGRTAPVSITVLAVEHAPDDPDTVDIRATARLSRSIFGVASVGGWMDRLDVLRRWIGDDVLVELTVRALRVKESAPEARSRPGGGATAIFAGMPTSATSTLGPPGDEVELAAARELLATRRDDAERLLNGFRAGVLLLLTVAAVAYGPSLTPTLNRVNALVLAPTLSWTILQWMLFYRRPRLPYWLAVVNPVVDITAVSAVILGYAFGQSAALAVRSPIFLAYLIILAGRPIASSARMAASIAALAVAEYLALVTGLAAAGLLDVVASPIVASRVSAVSPLDEGAKVLLLAVAGVIATYATHWQEALASSWSVASRARRQLESQLTKARLQNLKLQLRPHFLFNALNTVTALVHTDPRGAERMITGLSDLLRLSLHSSAEQEVPLSREVEILRRYLQIEQVRFQDRLVIAWELAEELGDVLVPNLILQPLVENAIRHGLAPRAAPGRVTIRAVRLGDRLQLEVADDGVGTDGEATRPDGVGLSNTRERLQSLYGDAQRLEIRTAAGAGFVVRIELPLRRAGGTTGAAPDALASTLTAPA